MLCCSGQYQCIAYLQIKVNQGQNDFKGILKFQQLGEEALKPVCRNLITKYSKDLSEDLEKPVLHLKRIYGATLTGS